MSQLTAEELDKHNADFAEGFRKYTDEELAWDFHCNVHAETKRMISVEAQRRGVNLCSIKQRRRGGPFVSGWTWQRNACSRNCRKEIEGER